MKKTTHLVGPHQCHVQPVPHMPPMRTHHLHKRHATSHQHIGCTFKRRQQPLHRSHPCSGAHIRHVCKESPEGCSHPLALREYEEGGAGTQCGNEIGMHDGYEVCFGGGVEGAGEGCWVAGGAGAVVAAAAGVPMLMVVVLMVMGGATTAVCIISTSSYIIITTNINININSGAW